MKKKLLIPFIVSAFFALSCCGTATEEAQTTTETTGVIEQTTEATTETAVEKGSATDTDASDDLSDLESFSEIEAEKELFDVKLTVPADIIGEVTQEELDESLEKNGYKSAKLNDDGSVTYEMTKSQHQELLDTIAEKLDEAIDDLVNSSDYPAVSSIVPNDDYTYFTVTTSNTELSLMETFLAPTLYSYGGMYAAFTTETVDNIHIDFVNSESGEVINTADSKDMSDSDNSEDSGD